MEYLPNIEFREDFSLTNTGEGLVDERKWIAIFSSNSVEFSEVDTETEASGRFLHEEDRGSVRCLAYLYKAFIEVI